MDMFFWPCKFHMQSLYGRGPERGAGFQMLPTGLLSTYLELEGGATHDRSTGARKNECIKTKGGHFAQALQVVNSGNVLKDKFGLRGTSFPKGRAKKCSEDCREKVQSLSRWRGLS